MWKDLGPIQIPFEIRKTNEKIGKISNFEFLASKLSAMISNHEFRLANSNHLQSKSEKMHVRKMKFEIRNSKAKYNTNSNSKAIRMFASWDSKFAIRKQNIGMFPKMAVKFLQMDEMIYFCFYLMEKCSGYLCVKFYCKILGVSTIKPPSKYLYHWKTSGTNFLRIAHRFANFEWNLDPSFEIAQFIRNSIRKTKRDSNVRIWIRFRNSQFDSQFEAFEFRISFCEIRKNLDWPLLK